MNKKLALLTFAIVGLMVPALPSVRAVSPQIISGPQINCEAVWLDTAPYQTIVVGFYGFDLTGSLVQASVNWGDGSASVTAQLTPIPHWCSNLSPSDTGGGTFSHYYTGAGYYTIEYFLTESSGQSATYTYTINVDPPTGGGGGCCMHPI